jgi:hypothetical protein
MIYYVYLHIKKSNGIPFYVGKGKKERYYSPAHRNRFWNNTVNKHGFDAILLEECLTEKEAFYLEEYWINRIGRADLNEGTLVNLTNGGEGESKRYISDSFRKKCSDRMKGHTINNGRKHSNEVNKKKGKARSKNVKAKKITYKGKVYGCRKDLWEESFTNISYSHFNYLINKNKI